jgi:hypothetical protein
MVRASQTMPAPMMQKSKEGSISAAEVPLQDKRMGVRPLQPAREKKMNGTFIKRGNGENRTHFFELAPFFPELRSKNASQHTSAEKKVVNSFGSQRHQTPQAALPTPFRLPE